MENKINDTLLSQTDCEQPPPTQGSRSRTRDFMYKCTEKCIFMNCKPLSLAGQVI